MSQYDDMVEGWRLDKADKIIACQRKALEALWGVFEHATQRKCCFHDYLAICYVSNTLDEFITKVNEVKEDE